MQEAEDYFQFKWHGESRIVNPLRIRFGLQIRFSEAGAELKIQLANKNATDNANEIYQ